MPGSKLVVSLRVLCVGAAHWDLIARSDQMLWVGADVPGQIARRPGGVALNVATGLAARGVQTRLCAVVGRDEAGASLIAQAGASAADCGHVLMIEGSATSRYIAIENANGELFAAIADTDVLEANADKIVDQASRALLGVDAVFLDANLPEGAIAAIAGAAVDSGVEIVANPVSAAKARRLDVLFSQPMQPTIIANLSEARVLAGTSVADAPEAAAALLQRGAETALVTDGERAAALATRDGMVVCLPAKLTGGVSVTGAGDALIAGYLAFPDRRGDPDAALTAAVKAAAAQMTVGC